MKFLILLACLGFALIDTAEPVGDSPQQFQKMYRDAVKSQDAKRIASMFLNRTPGEGAMVDVLAANEIDAAKLTSALEKVFGVQLIGGGTLVPPIQSDQWKIDGDLANIPDRFGHNPNCVTLRKVDGVYKIDLVAWGMDWLDKPDAPEARQRHRANPKAIDRTIRALTDGRYRTMGEFRDIAGDSDHLKTAPDSPAGNPPRPFRRPVKLDLSTPQAARRSASLAVAEGDGDAFLRCTQIVDPADDATMKVLARHITACATLQESAAAKFGIEAAEFGVPAEMPNLRLHALQELRELDDLGQFQPEAQALSIKGDKAQWTESGDVVAEMLRVNGEWKTPSRLTAEIGKKDADSNDWAKIYTLMADMEEDFARRIDRGEFATLKEAQSAIQRGVTNIAPAEPATIPSSAPP